MRYWMSEVMNLTIGAEGPSSVTDVLPHPVVPQVSAPVTIIKWAFPAVVEPPEFKYVQAPRGWYITPLRLSAIPPGSITNCGDVSVVVEGRVVETHVAVSGSICIFEFRRSFQKRKFW